MPSSLWASYPRGQPGTAAAPHGCGAFQMLVPRTLALAALLALLGVLSVPAAAQNAVRGQTLYNSFPYGCSDCHGGISNPKNDPEKGKASGGVKSGTVWQNIL